VSAETGGPVNSSPVSRPTGPDADLTPERWEKIKDLFSDAQRRNPTERCAFLQEACKDDESLRREVDSLLAAAEGEAAHPFSDAASSDRSRAEDAMIGRRVGAYKIIRRIGRGGMATVYLASRDDEQYEKQVAIKILLPELESDELLRRFRNERQTLAKLDHPNIVKLLDGGSTEEGLPYLVMDYVEGSPIDVYCDSHRLPTEGRLRLFCQVCAAVGCAHLNLVVHRDLKPSNILITNDGTPKLLDFGISKVLRPSNGSVVTQTLTRRMTPAYASPEQVRGETVTPATDIYSLGVVLYELLTGHRPYRLKQSTPAEVERAICEQEPEKPSTAVNRVETEALPDGTIVSRTPETVSALRESQPEKLRRRLSGDLDNIVLMALKKEPQRRYLSVEEFAKDTQRHLQHLPVKARPRTWVYRTFKFVRRHGTEVVAAAVVMVVMLTAIGYTSREQRRAEAKAQAQLTIQRSKGRRSIAVLGFKNVSARADTAWLSTALSEMLTTELSAGGKLRTIPGESVAQTKLDLSLPEGASLSKETLNRMYKNLGSDFVVLGSYVNIGDNNLRLDFQMQDAALGETVLALAETGNYVSLPELVHQLGSDLRKALGISDISAQELAGVQASLPANPKATRSYAEAIAKLRVFDAMAARNLLDRAIAADPKNAMAHAALADTWSVLGYEEKARQEAKIASDNSVNLPREQGLYLEGRYRDAVQQSEKAIEIYRTLFNYFPDNIGYGLRLVAAQLSAGKSLDALATLKILRSLPPPSGVDPRIDLSEAEAAKRTGDFKEQLTAATRAATKGRLYGARLLVAQALLAEAEAYHSLADLAQSDAASSEALREFAAVGDHFGQARAMRTRGAILLDQGDLPGAKKAYQDSLDFYNRLGNKAGEAAQVSNLALVLSRQKDVAGARQEYERALSLSHEVGDQALVALTLKRIANLERDMGDFASAEKHLRQALETARQVGNSSEIASISVNLGTILTAEGKFAAAKGLLEEALDIRRRSGEKNGLASTLVNLGFLHYALGELNAAQKSYSEALHVFTEIGNQPGIAYALFSLAKILEDKDELVIAGKQHEDVLAMRLKMGDEGYTDDSRLAVAEIALEQGRSAEAETAARQAIERYQKQRDQDNEVGTDAFLSLVLLAENRVAEAQTVIASARKLQEKSSNRITGISLAIADGRVRAGLGKTQEAVELVRDALAEARTTGFVGLQFDARLALGEVETKTANPSVGHADLRRLEHDARARGFMLIARKAAAIDKQQ
jgi:serine/threonine protein kinase/tetratricopeptide (TPR) repeat protein